MELMFLYAEVARGWIAPEIGNTRHNARAYLWPLQHTCIQDANRVSCSSLIPASRTLLRFHFYPPRNVVSQLLHMRLPRPSGSAGTASPPPASLPMEEEDRSDVRSEDNIPSQTVVQNLKLLTTEL